MNKKILILGASGNFGSKIAIRLAKTDLSLILSGRRNSQLLSLKNELQQINPNLSVETANFDLKDLTQQLDYLQPFIVVNTCGPFQNADYSVARDCAERRIHYIDIADGRDFVT